jgi:predicted nucleotidyltransferase
MRLSEREREAIKAAVAVLDRKARVYLYGSRVDDSLRGGDIDLLVVSDTLDFSDKIALLADIKCRIGEQKIDLTIKKPVELEGDVFVRSILSTAIPL